MHNGPAMHLAAPTPAPDPVAELTEELTLACSIAAVDRPDVRDVDAVVAWLGDVPAIMASLERAPKIGLTGKLIALAACQPHADRPGSVTALAATLRTVVADGAALQGARDAGLGEDPDALDLDSLSETRETLRDAAKIDVELMCGAAEWLAGGLCGLLCARAVELDQLLGARAAADVAMEYARTVSLPVGRGGPGEHLYGITAAAEGVLDARDRFAEPERLLWGLIAFHAIELACSSVADDDDAAADPDEVWRGAHRHAQRMLADSRVLADPGRCGFAEAAYRVGAAARELGATWLDRALGYHQDAAIRTAADVDQLIVILAHALVCVWAAGELAELN